MRREVVKTLMEMDLEVYSKLAPLLKERVEEVMDVLRQYEKKIVKLLGAEKELHEFLGVEA